MAIPVTYSILFEVNVLHHYFLNRGLKNFALMTADEQAEVMLKYDIRDALEIVPTAECRKNLDRHQCILRRTATGILAGLKAQLQSQPPHTYKPFHEIDNDLTFTFHMHLKDLSLLNYTNLPLNGNSSQVYLFSNNAGPAAKAFPSLCTFPSTFESGRQYLPGEMVVDSGTTPTKLYTARLKTGANPAGSPDWFEEKLSDSFPMSYAGAGDRIQLVRQQLLYRVKTADVEPVVVISAASGSVVEVKSDILPGQFRVIQIDLRGLPEGLYTLHAESADHTYLDDLTFYLLQQKERPFAILQLAVKSDTTAYNMLDAQGLMLSPSYELRLRNRATYWRYVGKKFNVSSVTSDPMPLTRFGFIDNVSVPDKDGIPVDDLPNPEVTMIQAEALTVQAEKKFYSEIHIN